MSSPKNQVAGTKGYYVADFSDRDGGASVIISAKEKIGSLSSILTVFTKHHVNLLHIESRPSNVDSSSYDFYIDADNSTGGLNGCVKELEENEYLVRFLTRNKLTSENELNEVPWFPRKIREIDRFANQILSYGSELDADHPGFTDEVYRKRRKYFADIAFNYRHGQKIPTIDYTEIEIDTWNQVIEKVTNLFPTHACQEFNYIFPLLVENCGYKKGNIPQLQVVSDFMKDCTGFILRPVAGLLSSRDFLAGLAFRVFHSTQYIRHWKKPLYTPEPDICHELLGHVPLFCDPMFAQFSQEIGLASLGASDNEVEKLATCYWFTVEFGLCREGSETKAYGAGLLSSYGELQYCLSSEPEVREFDPEKTGVQKYPITTYQPIYYVTQSFSTAKDKLIEFSKGITRPFTLRYNPYTQSVDIVDTNFELQHIVKHIKGDLSILDDALGKIITTK